MNNRTVTLITGGSRSGKSGLALRKALPYSRKIFLATAEVTDPEMAKRIQKHREERGPDFLTLEVPLYLAEAIRKNTEAEIILVDCLTFWLNNLIHHFAAQTSRIEKEINKFLNVLEEKSVSLILVTNEINMGVVAPDPVSRRFVDRQGWLNQEVARRADEVIFMVAGLPQILKGNELFLPRCPTS